MSAMMPSQTLLPRMQVCQIVFPIVVVMHAGGCYLVNNYNLQQGEWMPSLEWREWSCCLYLASQGGSSFCFLSDDWLEFSILLALHTKYFLFWDQSWLWIWFKLMGGCSYVLSLTCVVKYNLFVPFNLHFLKLLHMFKHVYLHVQGHLYFQYENSVFSKAICTGIAYFVCVFYIMLPIVLWPHMTLSDWNVWWNSQSCCC